MRSNRNNASSRKQGYDPYFERRTARFSRDEAEHSAAMTLMRTKVQAITRAGGLI